MVHCFVGCTRGGIAALRLRAVSTGIKRLKSTVYSSASQRRCGGFAGAIRGIRGELIVRNFCLI